jgi:hypothetical protein
MRAVSPIAGDFEGAAGVTRLKLSNAAPGTFFVVLGSIVILLTIFKGFTADRKQTRGRQLLAIPSQKVADLVTNDSLPLNSTSAAGSSSQIPPDSNKQ